MGLPPGGVALVAKPAGPTSHDVVDVARRALGTTRVGHLGTLDPFAEGLLVLVVGRATRLATYAGDWRKEYEGVIRLGARTSTDDGTGEVLAVSEGWRALDATALEAAFVPFRGAIAQRPPAHSAVKVAGERAYRRARRGETVDLPARPAEVHSFALVAWTPPDASFRASVGAGTYLRSLARDVGEVLGCGGHLVALRRTRVGPFVLVDAVAAETLSPTRLLDPEVLVAGLPRRDLTAAERDAVVHGRKLEGWKGQDQSVALFSNGQLVAVADSDGGVLKPRVVVTDA